MLGKRVSESANKQTNKQSRRNQPVLLELSVADVAFAEVRASFRWAELQRGAPFFRFRDSEQRRRIPLQPPLLLAVLAALPAAAVVAVALVAACIRERREDGPIARAARGAVPRLQLRRRAPAPLPLPPVCFVARQVRQKWLAHSFGVCEFYYRFNGTERNVI